MINKNPYFYLSYKLKRVVLMNRVMNNKYLIVFFLINVIMLVGVINYFYEKVTVWEALMAFGILMSLIAFQILFYTIMSKEDMREEYLEKINVMTKFIKMNGLGIVVTDKTIADIESNIKGDEILVIAPTLENDINLIEQENADIFETIKYNLMIGRIYKYIVPNSSNIYGAISEFSRKHTFKKEQVLFCIVPLEEYHFLSEIVIYDKGLPSQYVFEWFPNNEINFYFKFNQEKSINILGTCGILEKKYPFKMITEVLGYEDK